MSGVCLMLFCDQLTRQETKDWLTTCERVITAVYAYMLQRERESALDVGHIRRRIHYVRVALVPCVTVYSNDDDRTLVPSDCLFAQQPIRFLYVKVIDARADLLYRVRVELQDFTEEKVVVCAVDTSSQRVSVENLVTNVVLGGRSARKNLAWNNEGDCH
nr:hypothetical protein [Glaciibacter flavus]